uniref:Putative c-type lectin n=1 Tax=Psorophora albipes TaxID=869069 RepID=T1D562_9DIPT
MNRTIPILAALLPFASKAEVCFIPDITANWFEAQEICQSWGANLVTIPNNSANNAVVECILASSTGGNNVMTNYWIGANDLARPGTLKWVSNGKIATFIPWGPGEPNNAGGSEHCVNIQPYPKDGGGHVWLWNDDGCYKKFKFICEQAVTCVQEP